MPATSQDPDVRYAVDATRTEGMISRYIYGLNVEHGFSHSAKDYSTMVRLGGNRLTGFNWENNASNSGSDWHHHSDDYLCTAVVEGSDRDTPGSVALTFVGNCLSDGQVPLFTIPVVDRVSADMEGEVVPGDDSRWVRNLPRKGREFSLSPDLRDGAVYQDECVNYLTSAAGGGGRIFYCLDNEPDLWHETHPRIMPSHVTCRDLLRRDVEFAAAIKDADPLSTVFGPVSFGYSGFMDLAGAPDWKDAKAEGGYDTFIDYYLDGIARESRQRGRTLVDVLDIHWYPEVRGEERITSPGADSPADKAARLQAPRSLWDPTYREDSWISASSPSHYLPLLPRLRESVDRYCPGMKLAVTEYCYGGTEDISGAIALGEVLGIFGKYDVFAACHWGLPGPYGDAAFRLYRDYDGKKSAFGDWRLGCSMDGTWDRTGIFASASDGDAREIHLVVTNKHPEEALEGEFTITAPHSFTRATPYRISSTSPAIITDKPVPLEGNAFRYGIPPMSVVHLVIR